MGWHQTVRIACGLTYNLNFFEHFFLFYWEYPTSSILFVYAFNILEANFLAH